MGKKLKTAGIPANRCSSPALLLSLWARSFLKPSKQRLVNFNDAEEGKTLERTLGEDSYTMLQSLIRSSQLTVEVTGNS